jgi:hypothetical protein
MQCLVPDIQARPEAPPLVEKGIYMISVDWFFGLICGLACDTDTHKIFANVQCIPENCSERPGLANNKGLE